MNYEVTELTIRHIQRIGLPDQLEITGTLKEPFKWIEQAAFIQNEDGSRQYEDTATIDVHVE